MSEIKSNRQLKEKARDIMQRITAVMTQDLATMFNLTPLHGWTEAFEGFLVCNDQGEVIYRREFCVNNEMAVLLVTAYYDAKQLIEDILAGNLPESTTANVLFKQYMASDLQIKMQKHKILD